MNMRHLIRCSLAVLLGLAAALLVACGGSGKGLIPAASAGPLQRDFEAIEAAARTGNESCGATEKAIAKAQSDFQRLPGSVDSGLRTKLSEGLSGLRTQALGECEQPVAQTTTTGAQATTTQTQTTTTSTLTTQTSTQSTRTTPPETTVTSTTPPPPGGGTQAPGESSPPAAGEQGEAGATPGSPSVGGPSGGTGQGAGQ
jgi:hypothetical protein